MARRSKPPLARGVSEIAEDADGVAERERPGATGRRTSEAPDGVIAPGTVEARFEAFVGPLPHPTHFAAYERAAPGAGERILTIAEFQSKHRRTQEDRQQRADNRLRDRGQWFAFFLALGSLVLGGYLAVAGVPVLSGLALLFGFAEIGVALYWKFSRIFGRAPTANRSRDDVPTPPKGVPPPASRHPRET